MWGCGTIGGVGGLQGINGRDEGGLSCRPPSGEGSGDESREASTDQAPRIDHDVPHGEQDIVGGDGRSDRLKKGSGDLQAEEDTQGGSEEAEEEGFGHDEKDDGVAGEAD